MSQSYNFDIFKHFPKFTPLSLLNLGINHKFDYTPYMYIIKLTLCQFLVLLGCFLSKVSKENLFFWGGGLGKGRVKDVLVQHVSPFLPTKDSAFRYQCLHLTWFDSHGDR